MAKVLCTLPNASTEINGIRFVSHKLGMISEEIENPQLVKDLLTINGFHLHDPETGGLAIAEGSNAKFTGHLTGQPAGSGSIEATPEGLADAAKALSVDARQKLITLLQAQQPPATAPTKPAAAAAGAGPRGAATSTQQSSSPPPAAAPAGAAGSGAPSSTSTKQTGAAPAAAAAQAGELTRAPEF